jgi:hypothetical protein
MAQDRWEKKYPELAKVAMGLLEKGFDTSRVQDWLAEEGQKISTSTIDRLRETDEEREQRLDRNRAHNNSYRRRQREAGRTTSSLIRADAKLPLRQWVADRDFNPGT